MSSNTIRQLHRWLSLAFTVAVFANIGCMIGSVQAPWVGFLALVPLIPLLCSGLYLFVLPYLTKPRLPATPRAPAPG